MNKLEVSKTHSSQASERVFYVQEILESIGDRVGKVVFLSENTGDEYVSVETDSGKIVGEIYTGQVCIGDLEEEHLGVEVGEDFRRKGVGIKLYELWEILGYSLPEFEYTGNIDKFDFLQSLGYIPQSIVNRETGEEEEIYGEIPLDKIGKGYSCKFILES